MAAPTVTMDMVACKPEYQVKYRYECSNGHTQYLTTPNTPDRSFPCWHEVYWKEDDGTEKHKRCAYTMYLKTRR